MTGRVVSLSDSASGVQQPDVNLEDVGEADEERLDRQIEGLVKQIIQVSY